MHRRAMLAESGQALQLIGYPAELSDESRTKPAGRRRVRLRLVKRGLRGAC